MGRAIPFGNRMVLFPPRAANHFRVIPDRLREPALTTNSDEKPGTAPAHSDQHQQLLEIIGLGEFSARKSYYPELQQKIKELRESEARFRDFADAAADWFWEMGPDLCFSYISGRNEEIMGVAPESVIGLDRRQLYQNDHDLESPHWKQHLQTLEAHQPFTDFEIHWLRPDGEERYISVSGKPRFDDAGNFLGYRGVGRDITDRYRTEQALRLARKSDAMFRNLVENISGAAYRCLLDVHWTIQYISQGIQQITGFPPDDFVGNRIRSYASIIHPDDVERVDYEVRTAISFNRPYLLEYRIVHAEGGVRWIWERGRACDEDQSQPRHLEGVLADITEQKQTEQALRRAQKMDAVGQLTGGIAHDFNNILGIIIGNLDLLERSVDGDEKVQRRVETIRKSAQRATDLTRKLLGFSRQQSGEAVATNINQLMHGMHSLIARTVTPQVEVECQFAEDLWPTKVDPGDFEDALLNLVINAHDAMPYGGHLFLNTHNCTLDSDICSRNPDIPSGEYIRLTVRDNGRGIPAEQHERIFEPFFTTKAQGKGTGLGLAMVFGFIKRSSGYIKLESEPDRGTTFHIYLPRANATEGSHTPAGAKIDDSQRGHETILLVDDEQDLLELARESLLSLGYRVLTAQDGHEALKLINAEPGIDLMCSDVVMPGGINGYQLADRASAMRPNLKLLLVSGYTEKIITQRSHATPAIQLLSKPYTQTELACQVRMLLD